MAFQKRWLDKHWERIRKKHDIEVRTQGFNPLGFFIPVCIVKSVKGF